MNTWLIMPRTMFDRSDAFPFWNIKTVVGNNPVTVPFNVIFSHDL